MSYTIRTVEVTCVSDEKIEQAIESAAAFMKMEGFQIDPQRVDLYRRLLKDEITMDEYISTVTDKKTV